MHNNKQYEWEGACCLTQYEQYFSYIVGKTSSWDDNDVCFVLQQQAWLDFNSASSLRQQSTGKNVSPLVHIMLIQSLPGFALSP